MAMRLVPDNVAFTRRCRVYNWGGFHPPSTRFPPSPPSPLHTFSHHVLILLSRRLRFASRLRFANFRNRIHCSIPSHGYRPTNHLGIRTDYLEEQDAKDQ